MTATDPCRFARSSRLAIASQSKLKRSRKGITSIVLSVGLMNLRVNSHTELFDPNTRGRCLSLGSDVCGRANQDPLRTSWGQVAAFRLSRHHLSGRAPATALSSVAADMAGAQAQVLLAAQMSLWARVKGAGIQDLGSAIWQERTLVRAWCMRRTMYLLPSSELAVFVRGTVRRAKREIRWVLSRGVPEQRLEKLLDDVLQVLDRPCTQAELAQLLSNTMGYKLKFKFGGGWGSRRKVPWVEVRDLALPAGYLLHLLGAREVVCSGPSRGNESTFVRADRWIPRLNDIPSDQAERKLLVKYLKAFGPTTIADFALWTGMLISDAKEIWSREEKDIAQVDVEGWKAAIHRSDLPELEKAEIDGPIVRLLPYFDSFVLGHKSHRNIVDETNNRKIYRPQGWVSPVLLVNGRAKGVWSHVQKKDTLEVHITPFARLSNLIRSRIKDEASDLGRFLECSSVKTVIM